MYDVELVTQKNERECGPACLKMLLGYYGVDVPLEELSEECGTRMIGCTAKDMLRVGSAHGLDMLAYSMEAAELIRQDRPGIVWWKYTHFVVFCGQDEHGNVVIANPGLGRFPIDAESFSKLYTGVSLWNGEPQTLPEIDLATSADYEQALSDLGVEV